jgi:peptidoglycan/xylan/chitin deacetylase (PgdA/CDA1 family)
MGRRCARAWALPLAVCAALLVAAQGCSGSAPAPAAQRTPPPAVPILMWHVIGATPAGARLPALFVSPARFTSQVRALKRAGYEGVTMQQVWDAWHDGERLPRRPVVLSFDDGSAGQVRHALPQLRRAGWPGVLNLAWRFLPDIGGESAVQRLVRAGWEIDSHSVTHPDLTQLDDAALSTELTESRTRIRDAFGAGQASFFAYPSGRYDGRVKRAVRAAGYLAATTVKAGYAKPTADPYALPRIQVSRGTTAAALLRRLRELRP